jgi:glycosyltransferase involved in cell wall biosynthesis
VLVTDAWHPQVNGVVITLDELVRGLRARGIEVEVIEPSTFRRMPLPGYPGMELALWPGRQVARRLSAARADAVHVATEGPLGTAAVRWCRRQGVAHTTAFHTRFPEILASALRLPLSWGHAWFRRWHRHSAGVMVPSAGMLAELRAHGYPALREWTHGVDLSLFRPVAGADLGLPRPVWLYVGRVSWEKNLEAFLAAELPGSKVVYGEGPVRAELERRHPQVHWRGVVPRETLPAIYSAADAFVFPGRSETFGLVMLEALACGTPVAAYPVAGPRDVVGDHPGGVLHEDLAEAARRALAVPRALARERALAFGWDAVCERFLDHLVPARGGEVPSPVAPATPPFEGGHGSVTAPP